MRNKGFTHIYFGSGKGKTTSACGLALRAAGWGKKVYLFFLFKRPSLCGEIKVISKLENFNKFFFTQRHPFFINKDKPIYKKDLILRLSGFLNKIESVLLEKAVVVVADEILTALKEKLITEKQLANLVRIKNPETELILTGRFRPSKKLLELADYVSEIRSLKHPYEKGVRARKGIDF